MHGRGEPPPQAGCSAWLGGQCSFLINVLKPNALHVVYAAENNLSVGKLLDRISLLFRLRNLATAVRGTFQQRMILDSPTTVCYAWLWIAHPPCAVSEIDVI